MKFVAVVALAALALSPCTQDKQASSIEGMFTYMADAAIFRDCATGARWPVAMEADYLALERAYLGARAEPGAPVLVTVEATTEPRPKIDGEGQEPMLVVTRFMRARPGETCP